MKSIDIPDVGVVEFPDEMDDDAITRAIKKDIIPQAKAEAAERKRVEDYWSGQESEDDRPGYVSNIARGIGERTMELGGGFLRSIGQLAEEGGDWLERRFPLGTIGSPGTPMTEEQIRADTVPLMGAADALADTKLGYQPRTTWEDVKESPISNVVPFAFEQGLRSIPDMAAVMFAPGAYIAGRSGEIGQTRAENDGRESASASDILKSLPAATASALLERFGTHGMMGLGDDAIRALSQLPGAMGKAALKEGGTEFLQEGTDYLGETLGTRKGSNLSEGLERALAGAVAGAPFGGGIRGLTGSVQVWAADRGVAPTVENVQAAAAQGDSQAIDILKASGLMSDEQIANLSPEAAERFAERWQGRLAADQDPVLAAQRTQEARDRADLEGGDPLPEDKRKYVDKRAEYGGPTREAVLKAYETATEQVDRAIEAGDIKPKERDLAIRERVVGFIPELDKRQEVDPDKLTMMRARIDEIIHTPADQHTDELADEYVRLKTIVDRSKPARVIELGQRHPDMTGKPEAGTPINAVDGKAATGYTDDPGLRRAVETAAILHQPKRIGRGPGMSDAEVAYAQALARRTQEEAARGQAPLTERLDNKTEGATLQPAPGTAYGSESRLPQTRDDIADQRKAEEAFRLVAGKQASEQQPAGGYRARLDESAEKGEVNRDPSLGGRPGGGVESQKPVILDQGYPVKVTGDRYVKNAAGDTIRVAKVHRYDPRTGDATGPFDPETNEPIGYEVQADSLTISKYAQEPRRAQEFEKDARTAEVAPYVVEPHRNAAGKIVESDAVGKTVKPAAAGARIDTVQGRQDVPDPGLPRQTYRTTEPDPTISGAEGPTSELPDGGPVPRSPRPEQGEGPSYDLGSGKRGANARGGTTGEEWTQQEAKRRARMKEQAERGETHDEQGQPNDWGKAKSRYENQKTGYSGKPKGVDEDGWPLTDEDGYILSDKGGPIRFETQEAMKKRLIELRKAHPDAGIENEPHPGPMRKTGMGSAESYWTLRAKHPKPAKAQQEQAEQQEQAAPEQPAQTGPQRTLPGPTPTPDPTPKTSQPDTEKTPEAPQTDTKTTYDPDAPENAERTRRLRSVADRYEAIGNEKQAQWFRDKAGKAATPTITGKGTTDNLDGWDRLVKLDEERAAGKHTVTQPAKRGPVAPKLVEDIDAEMAVPDAGQAAENFAEGVKHVPPHITKAATDKLNELVRLRAERGYNGEDEPPANMKPHAIDQIDSRAGALRGVYNRYVKFLGAFKLGRNISKATKDGKREKVYTAETVGRELRKLQAEIAKSLPTDKELEQDVSKWSAFQLDNHIDTYGANSEDGAAALAELRKRPGWGNRRPNEVIKERQKIIKQLKASNQPANYAELEAKAADLEEDLARDPAWGSIRRDIDRRNGDLANMTPRQIAEMLRQNAAEERERGAGLKTKKAKETSAETVRSLEGEAGRIEAKIPQRDVTAAPEEQEAPEPEPEPPSEREPDFKERRIREGSGKEPGRRGAERGEPFTAPADKTPAKSTQPKTEVLPEAPKTRFAKSDYFRDEEAYLAASWAAKNATESERVDAIWTEQRAVANHEALKAYLAENPGAGQTAAAEPTADQDPDPSLRKNLDYALGDLKQTATSNRYDLLRNEQHREIFQKELAKVVRFYNEAVEAHGPEGYEVERRRLQTSITAARNKGAKVEEVKLATAKKEPDVPAKGTHRTVDGVDVVATGNPDNPWAGGKLVEKGANAGWQPDSLTQGKTPEEAAANVVAKKQRDDADRTKRTDATNRWNAAVEAAKSGEVPPAPLLKGATRYGDGKVSTGDAKAFLRDMGLTAKQADQVVDQTPELDVTSGGARLYDLARIVRTGQNIQDVAEVVKKTAPPKAETAPKPLSVAAGVKQAAASTKAGTGTWLEQQIVSLNSELERRKANKEKLAEAARIAKTSYENGPADRKGSDASPRYKDNDRFERRSEWDRAASDRDVNLKEIRDGEEKLKELVAQLPVNPPKRKQRAALLSRLFGRDPKAELTAEQETADEAAWKERLEQIAPRAETIEDIERILDENVERGILSKGTAKGIKSILARMPTDGLKGIRLMIQDRMTAEEREILGTSKSASGEYFTLTDDPDTRVLTVLGENGSKDAVETFVHENAHVLFSTISDPDRALARQIYDQLPISRQALHTVGYDKDARFEEWFAESAVDYYADGLKIDGQRAGIPHMLGGLMQRLFKRIVDAFSNEKAQVDAFFSGLERSLGYSGPVSIDGITRRERRGVSTLALLSTPISKLTGDWKAWKAGGQDMARDFKEALQNRGKRPNRQYAITSLARAIFYSADGEFRAGIGKFDSPTLNMLADVFHPKAGASQGIDSKLAAKLDMKLDSNATFDEAVTRKMNAELRRLDRVLDPFRKDPAALNRIVDLVQRPSTRRSDPESVAAGEIARMLRDMHRYMKDAGVDVGEIKNGYFPREIDTAAVMKDHTGFVAAATKAYRAVGLGAKEAKEAADNWLTNILYGGSGSPARNGKTGGSPSFVQSRVLTKQADEILKDFYQRDPDAILGSYVSRAVKRAEIARRFGDGWKNWEKIEKQIRAEDPAAAGMFDHLRSYAATATGSQHHNVPNIIRQGSSLIRTFASLGLLEKSTFSSLAEAITPAIRTGSARDFLPAIGTTLNELRRHLKGMPPSAAAELAADIGAIAGSGVNSIMAARFAGGDPLGRMQAKVLDKYFRRIFLTQWTDATRISSTERGAVFIRRLARDIAGRGLDPTKSRIYMAELGIPEAQLDEFVKFVNAFGSDLPSPADLNKGGAMGTAYRTALLRFDDQTIMHPNATTRPRWASHPVGAIAFQLQAFSYAFSKNVLLRSTRLAKTAWDNKEDLDAYDRLLMLAPMVMLAPLAMVQYMVGWLRDLLFTDPERRKALSRAAKVERAISRAGITGALDPYIQMVSGARYQRDPLSTLIGPSLGMLSQGVSAVTQMFANNTPNTNAAERKASEAVYDILIEPITNMLLGFAPVSPMTGLITAGLLPAMRDDFVDGVAGPRIGHKQHPVYGLSELMMGKQFEGNGGSGSWSTGGSSGSWSTGGSGSKSWSTGGD